MSLFNSKEIEELKKQNEELKTKLHFIAEKERNAGNLDEVLKKLRLEVSHLNEQKRSIKDEMDRLKELHVSAKQEISELQNRIDNLNEMKDDLQNTILSYTNRITDLEASANKNEANYFHENSFNTAPVEQQKEIEDFQEKIKEKAEEHSQAEQELRELEELKRSKINEMEVREQFLITRQTEIEGKLRRTEEIISMLQQKEIFLRNEISERENELITLNNQVSNFEHEHAESIKKVTSLQDEEQVIKKRINNLVEEEKFKHALIKDLNSSIAEKEEAATSLELKSLNLEKEFSEKSSSIEKEFSEIRSRIEKELSEKTAKITDLTTEFKKLSEDLKSKQKEFYSIDQSLNIKSKKLSSMNIEILDAEKKVTRLKEELSAAEFEKQAISKKLAEESEYAEKLIEENSKVKELTSLLERRREEIEISNTELESRFGKMFQKYNSDLNEINNKKNVLEKVLLKKEKDVEEKDQVLYEKIAALEESERVLNMRQAELESVEQVLGNMDKEKEMLKSDIRKLEDDSLDRKSHNQDLRLEAELLFKKRASLEKSMQELLSLMSENFNKSKDRKTKVTNEIREQEDVLQSFREKIAESIKELGQVEASLSAIKLDYEEQRGQVSKLKTLKKKLQDEITKHQSILQRYQKIRDRLRYEYPSTKLDETEDKLPIGGTGNAPVKGLKEKINPQIFKL